MNRILTLLGVLAITPLLATAIACSGPSTNASEPQLADEITIEEGTDAAAITDDMLTGDEAQSAPGVKKLTGPEGVIDYSNTEDGYVMVRYTGSTSDDLKGVVVAPDGKRSTYTLQPGAWTRLPLANGDGLYEVGIYKQVDGDTYEKVMSQALDVTLAR